MSTMSGRCFTLSVDAKVVWCLNSGHAVNPSMGARARLPVSHGPESRHHTPSAMRVVHRTVVSKRFAQRSVGAGVGYVQDERYIAIEHRDVRRDCVSFARDQYIHAVSSAILARANVEYRDSMTLCQFERGRSCASLRPRHTVHPEHKRVPAVTTHPGAPPEFDGGNYYTNLAKP